MKEQEISFQTSKLAKECGFEETVKSYNEFGKEVNVSLPIRKYNPNKIYYPRVTQGLLQKWLRETHNVIVEIIYDETQNDTFVWLIGAIYFNNINIITETHELFGTYFDNYEECLEEMLLESLKLLNKQQNEK